MKSITAGLKSFKSSAVIQFERVEILLPELLQKINQTIAQSQIEPIGFFCCPGVEEVNIEHHYDNFACRSGGYEGMSIQDITTTMTVFSVDKLG